MSKEVQAILEAERAEGKTEGMISAVLSMFKKKLIELSVAADELGMSEKEFLKLAKMA